MANFDFKAQLFAIESFIFLITQVLGIYVGYTLITSGEFAVAEAGSSIASFLVSFVAATIVLILMLKFFKGRSLFKILLAFLIFIGTETVFSAFVPSQLALLIAIEFVLLRFAYANVFTQNLTLIFAIAGIGATLGVLLPIEAVLVILAVLSVYDVIAVYKTKHMVKMFKGLIERGVPFSLIVPDKIENIKESVKDAQPGKGRFLLLGTGDVAFPVIFAIAALRISLLSTIAVIIGAFVGLFFIHLILLQKKVGAIPALPPIIFFSLIGFLLSIFML